MSSEKKIREFHIEDTNCAKGIAILLLCYYHLFSEQYVNNLFQVQFLLPTEISQMLVGFGNICVAIFLFLSAYGMTHRLSKKDSNISAMYQYSLRRLVILGINFFVMFVSVNALWFTRFDYAGTYGGGKQGIVFFCIDALGLAQLFGTPTLCNTWWYMEIAIICIILTPILVCAARKIGWKLILIAVVLPAIFILPEDFKRYYLVMVLGVVAAEENWLEKLQGMKIHKAVRILLCLCFLVASVLLRQNFMIKQAFAYLIDAPIALLIVYMVYECIPGQSIPGRIIGFLGKHSMNIYFVHTFFFMILWRDFIYMPRKAVLIFLLLVAVTLFYSVLLELIKKLIQIPRLIKLIDKWLGMEQK